VAILYYFTKLKKVIHIFLFILLMKIIKIINTKNLDDNKILTFQEE
jgi:hypothetical protein